MDPKSLELAGHDGMLKHEYESSPHVASLQACMYEVFPAGQSTQLFEIPS